MLFSQRRVTGGEVAMSQRAAGLAGPAWAMFADDVASGRRGSNVIAEFRGRSRSIERAQKEP